MKDFYSSLLEQIDTMLKEKYQFATNNDDGIKLLRDISNDIEDIVSSRLKEESIEVAKETILWLKNVIFEKVKIADGLSVSDLIFLNNYDLSELNDKDIELLNKLLEKSEFKKQIKTEINNRKYAN